MESARPIEPSTSATTEAKELPPASKMKSRMQANLRTLITDMTTRDELDKLAREYGVSFSTDTDLSTEGNQLILEGLLRDAAANGDLNDIRILIPYIKNLNAQDEKGATAIYYAMAPIDKPRRLGFEGYNLLLAAGADPTIQSHKEKKHSPPVCPSLSISTSEATDKAATEMPPKLRAWFQRNPDCEKNLALALQRAAYQGDYLLLDMLVNQPGLKSEDSIAALMQQNNTGKTALELAALDPRFDCYFYLLGLIQKNESSASEILSLKDNAFISKTLLDEECFLRNYKSFLERQKEIASRSPTLYRLVKDHRRIGCSKEDLETILIDAARNASLDDLRTLIDDGPKLVAFNINTRDSEGKTALHHAAEYAAGYPSPFTSLCAQPPTSEATSQCAQSYVCLLEGGANDRFIDHAGKTAWNYLHEQAKSALLSQMPARLRSKNDEAWIATLVSSNLNETALRVILKQLSADILEARSEGKGSIHMRALRGKAREKIAWLILMNNYTFCNAIFNRTVVFGAILGAIIVAVLALTAPISVPASIAVILGGAALGAAARKRAADTQCYGWFGLFFQEPAQMNNTQAKETVLHAAPIRGK